MMTSPSTKPTRRVAEIQTSFAAKYVTQLCKHFQHRLPVTLEDAAGHIAFSIGGCRARADGNTLTLELEPADDSVVEQLQDVVIRHLARFAFREALSISWRDA
jgi:hypothetical protein